MDKLRKFDFFRKPQEELKKSTILGACLSLITIVIILFFVLYSMLYPFWEESTRHQVALSQSNNKNQFTINLDIILYHSPCSAVTLEIKDKTSSQTIEHAQSGVTFQRTSNNGTSIDDDYIDSIIEDQYSVAGKSVMKLLTGLKNEERCRVNGSLTANKVPSIVSINYERSQTDLAEIKEIEPDLYSKLNLAHKIIALTFNSNKTHVSLEGTNTAKGTSFINDIPQSCNYYMRIIPYIYKYIPYKDNKEETYKYTMHSNCFVFFNY